MIYTVECSYADPASEAEWNAFYSQDKLPALISVRGFHSSQRFRALRSGCPAYLALHAIDGLAILTGEEYRRKGGGNFARWQQHITDWHRNLYAGLDRLQAVREDECLVLTEQGPEALQQLGLTPHAIEAVAMDRVPDRRWLAKAARGQLPALAQLPEAIHAYVPMTPQLTPGVAPAAA